IFKIYDAPSSGNLIWGETQTVTIDKGHFSALLGNGTDVANTSVDHDKLYQVFTGASASSRWLGITLSGSEILPRIQFFAAPYAQLARVANELASDTNGTIITGSLETGAGGLIKSGGDIQSGGSVIAQGNITGKDITGTKLNLTGSDNTITAGAITGTSISLGNGSINAGAITSTSLSAGSGPVTGNTLTLTGAFVGKNITGTSLSVGGGTIRGGAMTGTSLSVGTGSINAGTINAANVNMTGTAKFPKVGINLGNNSPKVPLQVNADNPRLFSTAPYTLGNAPSLGQYIFPGTAMGPGTGTGNQLFWSLHYDYLAAIFNGGVIVRDHIWATSAAINSDARAKTIHGVSDAAHDLDTLRKIKIQDFHWTDRMVDGFRPHKLTIAQQVEEVFPEAVMISPAPKAIPNIYSMASSVNHHAGRGELVLTLDKNHDLTEGDSVDLFSKGKEMKEFNVTRVLNEKTFAVASEQSLEEVFVYGKYVNDFRSVDYDAIAMLNVSATQELARKSEASVLETEKLKSRIRDLEARERRVAQLEKSLEAKLSRIELVEKRLDALDRRLVSVAPQIDRNSEGLQVSVRAGSSR
ncbi:MAG: hypothetical protein HON07_09650, partial [Planctomycetaceae bacterium]|nr:hypothetical protein [Planctomycetaceae bacterium]